jgi:hypothetical protein
MEFTTRLAILGIYAGIIIINVAFIAYRINEVAQEHKKGHILICGNIMLLLHTIIRMIKL